MKGSDYIETNWWITIMIFAASFYSVLILYIILYALYKILDNQDKNLCEINKLAAIINEENKELTQSDWSCPECGRKNNYFIKTCRCGASKPNSITTV